MFLITTADQRFWKSDEKILFLGNWCKVYDQEKIWSALDYEVLPYHWDDRSKLFEDYKYLNTLYERVLRELTDELNKLHNIEYSVRYWRIVVGPWLHYFLETLYDRYLSISSAVELGKTTFTRLPSNLEWIVPDDFQNSSHWLTSHEYNLFLYSRLIKDLGGLNYEKINAPLKIDPFKPKVKPCGKNTLIKIAEYFSNKVPDFLNKIVFIASYIKPTDLFRLQLSLGQIPYFCINEAVELKPFRVNTSMRNRIRVPSGSNQFESILPGWISQQIPKVYVEGYSNMVSMARKKYPKNPTIIFTASALFGNDGFKMWAGENVARGTKLVGSQHGGAYGISLWSANETHETKVVDKYFTWGWKNSDDQATVPLSSARLCSGKYKIKNNPSGRILWAGYSDSVYSHCSYSSPVGPQYLDYIDDQKKFLKGVCTAVRKLLLLRLYPMERGWHEIHMWQHLDPPIEFYRGDKSNLDQLNESRLSIGTYNGMGVLETLSANYPTIIFWNPNHWEIRESAKPIFDKLLSAGIFHDNPQSAASQVNEIYQDVQSWWMSVKVQKAREIFCDRFANTSKPLVRLKEELLQLLSTC